MAERVCPWWMGRLLLNPWRQWRMQPERLLEPYVRAGMTVLEPGPGMGFFTLTLARLVGAQGRVIAVDLQPKMLEGLRRRAQRAGLAERIETRVAGSDSLGIGDLAVGVDFVLASAVVHEVPPVERFFEEIASVLRPGGAILLAEPKGHVTEEKFAGELRAADGAGLQVVSHPALRGSLTAVLRRPVA
ncbi:MAG TPA: class I SAM-dependent methyltransferase [Acidobacteriaceae bacterium]|nr:class I SAM-dependent methyltransferase [Acidobacteriaceae bacterium]